MKTLTSTLLIAFIVSAVKAQNVTFDASYPFNAVITPAITVQSKCKNCLTYAYPEFTVTKDTVTWQTVAEYYTVIGANVKPGIKQFDRNKIEFHADKGQPNMKIDYYKSGYAIGHVNSAKNNAYSLPTLTHSMLYINTNLQEQSMNAGPWLGLEDHERDEAIKYGSIKVISGVYGSNGDTTKTHRAVVPAYWWKVIVYKDSARVWVMPNIKMPQHTADYVKYRKSQKFLTDTLQSKIVR